MGSLANHVHDDDGERRLHPSVHSGVTHRPVTSTAIPRITVTAPDTDVTPTGYAAVDGAVLSAA
jgi:hypothetical protein